MSKTRDAIGALLTRLATINGSGGYTYNLSGSDKVRYGRWTPDQQVSPAAYVTIGESGITSEHGPDVGSYSRTLNLEIVGIVTPSAQTAKERVLAASDLLDDILEAIESDRTLGGVVEDFIASGSAFDGDEAGAAGFGVCYLTCVLTWEAASGEGV